ncbi:nucleotidyltransferase family protein [Geomicrobium sp. JCM 19038]|uniref:nucleotidyltransferase family protein n=1 Tax=Geomicrobium sp. JCM 19038 TaxID=1460635 RepID=UPI00045F1D9D|nr:nucleotidyltransferase family protein [Geomicrobium sp. JCM 19038]GAK09780.1 hypothetical protein JCM19038_3636 [Geomicrobium sp. JCM 19038]
MYEQKLKVLIERDEWMMDILQIVQQLELQDWWVCAGFVRSKIWDTVHAFTSRTSLADIDVIHFDKHEEQIGEQMDRELEDRLRLLRPNLPWSVKNQVRMHNRNGVKPYLSSTDAMSKFPETATSLGVSLDNGGKLIISAPHGLSDAFQLHVKPTPTFLGNQMLMPIYKARLAKKKWHKTWPRLTYWETSEYK